MDNLHKIKYIISDIDGVLTDGRFVIDENGNESKQLCYRDLDAIGIGRRAGLEFAFLTGESGKMVEVISTRFNVFDIVEGSKDKLTAIKIFCEDKKVNAENVCYIGDSDRDVLAIDYAGVGIAPRDGSPKAIATANYITEVKGGFGVLFEVVSNIVDNIKE